MSVQTGPDQRVEQSETIGLPVQNDAFDKLANGAWQRNGICLVLSFLGGEQRRLVLVPKHLLGWDPGSDQTPHRLTESVEIGAGSERDRLFPLAQSWDEEWYAGPAVAEGSVGDASLARKPRRKPATG